MTSRSFAANLIHYCKERNILVLAEGVERIEEVHTMLLLGADLFQGYYFGRPELEIRPVNPYVIEKMRKLLQKIGLVIIKSLCYNGELKCGALPGRPYIDVRRNPYYEFTGRKN